MLFLPTVRDSTARVSNRFSYLDEGRYTWRHNSVLLFLANTFSSLKHCTVYADLPSFLSPCMITGESLRPDLLLLTEDKLLYILELTIGFETYKIIVIVRLPNIAHCLVNTLLLTIKLNLSFYLWVPLELWALLVFRFSRYSLN